jgi:Ca2+-binding EF-hand superfamily protein
MAAAIKKVAKPAGLSARVKEMVEEEDERRREEEMLRSMEREKCERSCVLVCSGHGVQGTGALVKLSEIDCVITSSFLAPTPAAAHACKIVSSSTSSSSSQDVISPLPAAVFEHLEGTGLVVFSVTGNVEPASLYDKEEEDDEAFILLSHGVGHSLRSVEVHFDRDHESKNGALLKLKEPLSAEWSGSPIFSVKFHSSCLFCCTAAGDVAVAVGPLLEIILLQRSARIKPINRQLLAIASGNAPSLVQELSRNDFDMPPSGLTLPHIAAMMGSATTLDLFRGGGTLASAPILDHRAPRSGDSLAHVAAYHGQTSVLELVRRWGVSLEEPNHYGMAPICMAALRGDTSTLQWFIQRGVDASPALTLAEGLTPEVKRAVLIAPMTKRSETHIVEQLQKAENKGVGDSNNELLKKEAEEEPLAPGDLAEASRRYAAGAISPERMLAVIVEVYGEMAVRGSAWPRICSSAVSEGTLEYGNRDELFKAIHQAHTVYMGQVRKRRLAQREQAKQRRAAAAAASDHEEQQNDSSSAIPLRRALTNYSTGHWSAHDLHAYLLHQFGADGIKSGLGRIARTLDEAKQAELRAEHDAWRKEYARMKQEKKKMLQQEQPEENHTQRPLDLSTGLSSFCSGDIDAGKLLDDYLRPLFGANLANSLPSILKNLPQDRQAELAEAAAPELSKRMKRTGKGTEAASTPAKEDRQQNPFAHTKVTGWSTAASNDKKEGAEGSVVAPAAAKDDRKQRKNRAGLRNGGSTRSATDFYIKLSQQFSAGKLPVTEYFARLESGFSSRRQLKEMLPVILHALPSGPSIELQGLLKAMGGLLDDISSTNVAEELPTAVEEKEQVVEHRRSSVQSKERGELDSLYALTEPERARYAEIFQTVDSDGSGHVSGAEARELLSKSGLPQKDLARIWALADKDKCGELDVKEFVLAMHLIMCVAKRGLPVPRQLPVCLGGDELVSMTREEGLWVMTADDRHRYDKIFQEAFTADAPSAEFLAGRDAHALLMKKLAPLDSDELASIWKLAGALGYVRINAELWALLMHLASGCKRSVPLPHHLPKCLRLRTGVSRQENQNHASISDMADSCRRGEIKVEELYFDCMVPALGSSLPTAVNAVSKKLPSKKQRALENLHAEAVRAARLAAREARRDPVSTFAAGLCTAADLLVTLDSASNSKKQRRRALKTALASLPRAKARELKDAVEVYRAASATETDNAIKEKEERGAYAEPVDVKSGTKLFRKGELTAADYHSRYLVPAFGNDLNQAIGMLLKVLPAEKAQELEAVLLVPQEGHPRADEGEGNGEIGGQECRSVDIHSDSDPDGEGKVSPWSMSLEDRALYDKAFKKLDKDGSGFISRTEIRALFRKAGFSESETDTVWGLADLDKNPAGLSKPYFAIAYHMVRVKMHHDLELPAELPKPLRRPSREVPKP